MRNIVHLFRHQDDLRYGIFNKLCLYEYIMLDKNQLDIIEVVFLNL